MMDRVDYERARMHRDLEIGRGLGIGPSLADMEAYRDRINEAAYADAMEVYYNIDTVEDPLFDLMMDGDSDDEGHKGPPVERFGPEVLNQAITVLGRTEEEQEADIRAFLARFGVEEFTGCPWAALFDRQPIGSSLGYNKQGVFLFEVFLPIKGDR